MDADLVAVIGEIRALLAAGRHEEAARAARAAIQAFPAEGYLRSLLAGALMDPESSAERLRAEQEAVRLDPYLDCPRLILSHDLARLDRVDEAAAVLREALAWEPGRLLWWQELGRTYEGAGRYDEAVTALREAIRIEPENAHLHVNLGDVLWESGRLAEARAAFESAIRIGDATWRKAAQGRLRGTERQMRRGGA